MKFIEKFKNLSRNYLGKSILGRILLGTQSKSIFNSICVISATRMSERDFWRKSALGQSLKSKLTDPHISFDIHYKNTVGLPTIYNAQLQNPDAADILIFVQDDVWLDDPDWVEKIKLALRQFDIVGVAGNTRISKNQIAWNMIKLKDDQYAQDSGYLSGGIAHAQHRKGELKMFGPTPARCKLLDGVMLAVSRTRMQKNKVIFDARFDFPLHSLDFCRTAHKAGLSLGTWPIALTHQSGGEYQSEKEKADSALYLKKWGG